MSGESQDMMVVHCAQNCTQDVQQVSLWGITALQTGGLLIVPQNEKNDLFSGPNRTFSLWPYSDLKDPRLWIGNQYMTWEEMIQHPALFPFHIDDLTQADMASCEHLCLEHMGDDVVIRVK